MLLQVILEGLGLGGRGFNSRQLHQIKQGVT